MPVNPAFAVFEKAMRLFGYPRADAKIAVAVSGGADSTALALMAKAFTDKNGGKILALTVDHGLRPTSANEAAETQKKLERTGVPCLILRWDGTKPDTGIEEAARAARYRLLFDACRQYGYGDLLLAHHRRDQAETYLMRRAKNSGDIGLAGMSAAATHGNVRVLRPLLGAFPEDLRAFNTAAEMDWVEDETNSSDAFERGRLRQTVSPAEMEKAFRDSLIYAEKRQRTERAAVSFFNASLSLSEMGFALFDRRDFTALSADAGHYALGRILQTVGSKEYPPAGDSVRRIMDAVRGGEPFGGFSLSGCRIAPAAKKRVLVWREKNSCPPPLETHGEKTFFWDRFRFFADEDFPDRAEIKPLGDCLKVEKFFPKRVVSVLPAIFDVKGLFIVPHLGYKRERTGCRVSFEPSFSLPEKAEWTLPVLL